MRFKDKLNLQERAIGVMTTDVFISYSSAYRKLVDALVHYLEENKIKCWYAPRDITPGIEYAEAIDIAIKNSRFFIILVSDLSQQSNWCRSEVNLAVGYGKTILPVRIENVELMGAMKLYLNDKHWIEAFPDPESSFNNIRSAILCFNNTNGNRVINVAPTSLIFIFKEILSSTLLYLGVMLIVSTLAFSRDYSFTKVIPYLGIGLVFVCVSFFACRIKVFAKITKQSFSGLSLKSLGPIFLRKFFGAWGFWLALLLLGVMPVILIFFPNYIMGKDADRDGLQRFFLFWFMSSGFHLALMKTGYALMLNDKKKFSFTAKRFCKWVGIIIIPFIISLIFGFIFILRQ